MPLIQKAKTGTGYFIQIVGYLIWLGCGLYIMIWEFNIIADALSIWVAILAVFLFPVLFVFAVPIAWFLTGTFPLTILILWLFSLVGMAIAAAGSSMREAQGMGWFQRHLNWTYVFTYLLWVVANASDSAVPGLVALVFLTIVSGWVIKQKGRSLWWLLLLPFFSPWWLKETKTIERHKKLEKIPMEELSTEELLTLKEKHITDESGVSIIDDELATRAKEAEEG